MRAAGIPFGVGRRGLDGHCSSHGSWLVDREPRFRIPATLFEDFAAMLSTEQIREWLDSLHRVDSRRIILATLIRLLEEPSEPRIGCRRSPAIHANGAQPAIEQSSRRLCHLRATALESTKLRQLRICSLRLLQAIENRSMLRVTNCKILPNSIHNTYTGHHRKFRPSLAGRGRIRVAGREQPAFFVLSVFADRNRSLEESGGIL
jgi:hypothetical protein